MKHFMSVLKLFPNHLRGEIMEIVNEYDLSPEELRVRIGRPITVRCYGMERDCTSMVTKADMLHIIGSATDCSYHTAVRHMQNGYIPLRDGSRMGVCGNGVGADGVLRGVNEIHSLCIRIASEQIGCGDEIWEAWMQDGFRNTIIIAPPGAGKTTLLRELIRRLSVAGYYVGAADERRELSGQYNGQASFELGPRCDVLAGVPKQAAAMMLLRSMAPQVLAMDEITAFTDMEAIQEAVGCGVGLLTTIHGDGVRSLEKPAFQALQAAKVFEWGILIHCETGRRRYEVVRLYD